MIAMFTIVDEMGLISLFLEGFLYGLYTAIFAMYLQCKAPKQLDTNKAQNILFYSMCVLYVASASVFVCDIILYMSTSVSLDFYTRLLIIQTTLFACCDFIAQFILIYRCWIVWGRNIRIVIIPSTLAFAFLVIWVLSAWGGGSALEGLTFTIMGWETLTGLALSLTVNALVMGLIVFRIFKVFQEVKATSYDKNLSATGGSKLRRTILVLVESAMVLFSIQLARLVVCILQTETDIHTGTFSIIVTIHQMLNGITPTIILVRISMGLSFHDEKSMEEPCYREFALCI